MSNLVNMNVLITDFFYRWRSLIGELLGSDSELLNEFETDKMQDLHNKLALTVLTQEKYLLAITGLQGSGKTTLIKRLYNLDNTYLRDNLSRGEVIPILITESNISEPEGYVVESNYTEKDGFFINTKFVNPDEFDRISKSPFKEEIWLELKVPFRHFNDDRRSFILLPGFEKDKEEFSQKLLEHVLYLSTASVVVFRKDTLARSNNIEMISKIKEIYGEIEPLYILTHGDVNPESNKETMEQFCNLLDVSEKNRVILSGDSNFFKENWVEQFNRMIGKYAFLTNESEQKKLLLLQDLFGDIREEINLLEIFLKKQEDKLILSESSSFERNTHRLVQQFEIMYEKVLNELEKSIIDSLQSRKEDAINCFNNYVKENETFWSNLFSKFKPNALENEKKLHDALKKAWSVGENTSEIDIINAVTNYSESKASLLKKENIFKVISIASETVDQKKIGINSNNKEESFKKISLEEAKKMSSMQRINAFFSNESKTDLIPLYREDLKMLTLLGEILCRQSLYEKHLWDNNKDVIGNQQNIEFLSFEELDKSKLNTSMNNIKEFSEDISIFIPQILKTIPLILGVDIIVDGKADLVLNATNALMGIGLKITPIQLLGAIGAVVILAYGLDAVKQAVHEVNQRQLKLSRAGYLAINQLPEIQAKAYTQTLRIIFEKITDHLADVHKERLGEYDSDAQIESIRYSLRRVKLANNKLQKMVYTYAPIII